MFWSERTINAGSRVIDKTFHFKAKVDLNLFIFLLDNYETSDFKEQ